MQPGALAEVRGLTALLASVRPCDGVSIAISRSRPKFDANASPTTWILETGLRQLDPTERQRIVDSWSTPRWTRWSSLITDGGCDVRIGDVAVTGAVRGALLDWLPVSGNELAIYETGLFRQAPANALALLVRPPTIWPIAEALIADRVFPRGPVFEPARFDAVERYAYGRLQCAHLARLRRSVARIGTQLAVERFPNASDTVAAGCASIAHDDEWGAAIAARQLARYVTSAFVGREALARASPRSAGSGPHASDP